MSGEQPKIGLSQDAAIVLALADTAIPFAASREDEAERWVRVLRLHGQVGGVLQALGIGAAPLETTAYIPSESRPGVTVGAVAAAAQRFGAARGAGLVS